MMNCLKRTTNEIEYMKLKLSLLAGLIFSIVSLSHSQIELEADGGSFESLISWNEGYLGVVQTQAYAVVPKYRQFQYFNSKGEMAWNKKIVPFNFNNVSICHSDSDYSYFINMPFSKTAMLERTSKTEFLNVHQVNKEGKVIDKAISYSGALSPLKGYVKKLYQYYVVALKDGFVIVVSNDDEKYHIVRVHDNFEVDYASVDFEWDYKKWSKNELSKVKFVTGEDEISLIQIEDQASGFSMNIKTFNLDDFSEMKEVTNTVNLSGYNLRSKAGQGLELLYSTREHVFSSYVNKVWRGDKLYIRPTLGSFVNFVSTKEGLKMYSYYRNIKEGTKKEVDKEGFLAYDINTSESEEGVKRGDFVFSSDEDGSSSHKFHVTEDGEFISISKQSKKVIVINSSNGKEMTFDEKLTMAEAYFSYISGEKRSKSDAVDVITFSRGKYYGINFDGISNSLGNTKRAIVYEY